MKLALVGILGFALAFQAAEPVPPTVVVRSPWTPEMLMALGVVLTGILGGIGKLIGDLRTVSKQNTVIHQLVNSRMTLALTTIARLARSVAKLTKDPADEEAARAAEEALRSKQLEDARAEAQRSPFARDHRQN